MSEYQLDLMFEYIDGKSDNHPGQGTLERMAQIRKLLLDDARANEEQLDKISASIDKMRAESLKFK